MEDYFETQKRDILLFNSLSSTQNFYSQLESIYQKYGINSPQYSIADSVFGLSVRQLQLNHHFKNIWFLNANTDVIYTTVKNRYSGKNLRNYSGINQELIKCMEMEKSELILVDLPYLSSDNPIPQIIMIAHIKDKNGFILVKINIDQINAILSQRTGMGETGESYVVSKNLAMRSNSRFIEFDRKKGLIVNTIATKEAFNLVDGQAIIEDYRGIPVLSSFTKLKTIGIDWALISEIDLKEAMKPIYELRRKMIAIDAVICFFIILITIYLSKKIAKLVSEQNKIKTAALVQGQENERKRMSRELHDGIGQMLTALKFKVQEITIKSETIQDLKQMIDDTTVEVRRVSINLMPSVLWDFGLESALNILIKNTKLDINLSYIHSDQSLELNMDVRTCIYRLVQESISNVLKHGETPTLTVQIKQDPLNICLLIQDSGKGFDIKMYRNNRREIGSNGIRNMKERVWLLNGKFELSSEIDKGTKILVNIPLQIK